MENGKVKSILILSLVLGLLSVQSTASFTDCYEACFIICFLTPETTLGSCAIKCLKDCILPPNLHTTNMEDTQYFCKLGCATSKCTNISTKDNPAGKKVEGCVDSCAKTCNKN